MSAVSEVLRLHVPAGRCDVSEHGAGTLRCKNCGGLWHCRFITAIAAGEEPA